MANVTLVVDGDDSIEDRLSIALAGTAAGVEFASDVATAKAMLDTQRYSGLVLTLDAERCVDVLEHLHARSLAIPTVIVAKKVPPDVRRTLDSEVVKLVFPKPIETRLLASVVLGLCGIAL